MTGSRSRDFCEIERKRVANNITNSLCVCCPRTGHDGEEDGYTEELAEKYAKAVKKAIQAGHKNSMIKVALERENITCLEAHNHNDSESPEDLGEIRKRDSLT